MVTLQGQAALQLAVDQKSRYVILNRLPRRTAAAGAKGPNPCGGLPVTCCTSRLNPAPEYPLALDNVLPDPLH